MKKTIALSVLMACVLASCGTSKKATTATKKNTRVERRAAEKPASKESVSTLPVRPAAEIPVDNVSAYIDKYKDIAKEEMAQYGVPASITLAQAILESGAGKGELVLKARNHFGIKCHRDWKGQKVYHDDDQKGECFRKYSLDKFSFTDHSMFLANRSRYIDLFKLPKDDYKGWAKGLKKAGYATDPKYPQKLIKLVERYQLYRYDGEVLGKEETDYGKVTDKQDQHTVSKGETLYSISKRYKLSVDKLKEINGLESNEIFVGQVLYIKEFDRGY